MSGISSLNFTPGVTSPLRAPATAPLITAAPASEAPLKLEGDRAELSSTPDAPTSLSDLVARAKAASATRRPAEVRSEAEGVWTDSQTFPAGPRVVERDFMDVNAAVTPGQAEAAGKQLEANAPLEAKALAALNPAQRQAYQRVQTQTADDPPAKLALQVLLIEGKLTDSRNARDGKGLLSQLDTLSTEKLAPGLDRKALVSDLVQEIATPSAINQQNRASCIYTSMQIQLAQQRPAEYARIVGGFASSAGTVKLANGDTARRLPGAEKADDSQRSDATRLFTTGIMGYGSRMKLADQLAAPVDNAAITVDEEKVIKGLGGKPTMLGRFSDPMLAGNHPEEVLAKLQELTSKGQGVRASINLENAAGEQELHQIVVQGVDAQGVHYLNPWGTEDRMKAADFMDRLGALSYQLRL